MSIKDAFSALKRGVADLSTVEVNTFVGDLSTTLTEVEGETVINWQSLMADAKAKTNGTVELMASSRYEFDGDSQLLINPAITAEMQHAHDAAVQAGLEVRQTLIDTFYDVIDVAGN